MISPTPTATALNTAMVAVGAESEKNTVISNAPTISALAITGGKDAGIASLSSAHCAGHRWQGRQSGWRRCQTPHPQWWNPAGLPAGSQGNAHNVFGPKHRQQAECFGHAHLYRAVRERLQYQAKHGVNCGDHGAAYQGLNGQFVLLVRHKIHSGG